MKRFFKSFISFLISTSTCLGFLLPVTSSHRAQQRGSSRPDAVSARKAEQDMIDREWNLTRMTEEADKKFKQEQVSLFAQVKEDFTYLQTTNNNLMRTVFVDNSIDYAAISDAIGEIRKRAFRLRQNLVLPKTPDAEPAPKKSDISNEQQLKASLLALDHSVMSFVKNPIFQSPNVIDQTLATNAGRDLEAIIQSSNTMKKEVERLKAANKR